MPSRPRRPSPGPIPDDLRGVIAASLMADGGEAAAALAPGAAADELKDALRVLDQAAEWQWPVAMCEAHTDVARCLAALHSYAASEAQLVLAYAWAERIGGAADTLADLCCAMAEVACNEADLIDQQEADDRASLRQAAAARRRARVHAESAAELAAAVSDAAWQASVLMRAADVLERGGDVDDAVTLQRQAQALTEPISPSTTHALRHGVLRHSTPEQLM